MKPQFARFTPDSDFIHHTFYTIQYTQYTLSVHLHKVNLQLSPCCATASSQSNELLLTRDESVALPEFCHHARQVHSSWHLHRWATCWRPRPLRPLYPLISQCDSSPGSERAILIRLTICILLCLYRSECTAVDPEALLVEARVVREIALIPLALFASSTATCPPAFVLFPCLFKVTKCTLCHS